MLWIRDDNFCQLFERGKNVSQTFREWLESKNHTQTWKISKKNVTFNSKTIKTLIFSTHIKTSYARTPTTFYVQKPRRYITTTCCNDSTCRFETSCVRFCATDLPTPFFDFFAKFYVFLEVVDDGSHGPWMVLELRPRSRDGWMDDWCTDLRDGLRRSIS